MISSPASRSPARERRDDATRGPRNIPPLTRRAAATLLALTLLALVFPTAHAQPAPPHLGFVYPAGAQPGTKVTVQVGGQNLGGTAAALLSGGNAEIRVAGYERPLTQREINDLREEAQRLQDKRAAARKEGQPAFTTADEARVAEIRQLLASRGNRQTTAAIADTVTLEISLPPGSPPGERELRLKTPGGLSNPLVFCIGQPAEISAAAITSTTARPPRVSGKRGSDIALPATINGQILPGEVDRYQFAARKGQRLTFVVRARALIPYLADAVPGWFQPTLAIRDERGRELAYSDDYRFAPDPVIACEIPADGTYLLEIKDALFRGREDFVYRIAAGELPLITSVFPLGGAVDGRTSVELHGWNLPQDRLVVDAGGRGAGALLLSVVREGVFSNSVRFAVDRTPDRLAPETDEDDAAPAPVELPVILNGRIERAGDEDRFRFSGRAGDTIVAEVMARRLGSPLDSVLTLCDAAGRPLATNDDAEDKAAGLLTHHADSQIIHRLPADGAYTLRIADAQRKGGVEYGYRLRLGPPQPGFELRVVPSSINVRAGGTVPVTVYALRRDGFTGEIALGLQDAPAGFAVSGGRIPPGADSVTLTLTAPPQPREETLPVRLAGRATINGAAVTRAAVPADDMMQAFAYHHLVPARELRICVVGRGSTPRWINPGVVRLTPGKAARVRVAVASGKDPRTFTFELVEPPPGVTVAKVTCANGTAEILLECDPARAKAGAAGNLILQAFAERPGQAKAGQRAQRSLVGTLPALPFEIAPALHASL